MRIIKDYWKPTDEELQVLIEYCLPFDAEFGERIFSAILAYPEHPAANLNVFYEVRDKLDENCPESLINMIQGFESVAEYYDD